MNILHGIIDGINNCNSKENICLKCGHIGDFKQIEKNMICNNCGDSIDIPGGIDHCTDVVKTDKLYPESGSRIFVQTGNIYVNKNINIWSGVPYAEKVKRERHNWIKLRLNEYAKLTAYEHKIQKIVAEDTILPESNARAEDTIVRKTLELFQLINKEAMSRKPVIFGVIAFAYYYTCKNLNIYVTRKELLRIFKITKDTLDRGNKKINKVIKNSPILQKYIDMNYWKIEDILKGLSKTFPKVTQSQVQLFRDVYDLMSFTQIEKHLQTESLLTGIMINAINILGFATYTTFDIQYIFKISPSTTNNSIEKSIFYVRLLK